MLADNVFNVTDWVKKTLVGTDMGQLRKHWGIPEDFDYLVESKI